MYHDPEDDLRRAVIARWLAEERSRIAQLRQERGELASGQGIEVRAAGCVELSRQPFDAVAQLVQDGGVPDGQPVDQAEQDELQHAAPGGGVFQNLKLRLVHLIRPLWPERKRAAEGGAPQANTRRGA